MTKRWGVTALTAWLGFARANPGQRRVDHAFHPDYSLGSLTSAVPAAITAPS